MTHRSRQTVLSLIPTSSRSSVLSRVPGYGSLAADGPLSTNGLASPSWRPHDLRLARCLRSSPSSSARLLGMVLSHIAAPLDDNGTLIHHGFAPVVRSSRTARRAHAYRSLLALRLALSLCGALPAARLRSPSVVLSVMTASLAPFGALQLNGPFLFHGPLGQADSLSSYGPLRRHGLALSTRSPLVMQLARGFGCPHLPRPRSLIPVPSGYAASLMVFGALHGRGLALPVRPPRAPRHRSTSTVLSMIPTRSDSPVPFYVAASLISVGSLSVIGLVRESRCHPSLRLARSPKSVLFFVSTLALQRRNSHQPRARSRSQRFGALRGNGSVPVLRCSLSQRLDLSFRCLAHQERHSPGRRLALLGRSPLALRPRSRSSVLSMTLARSRHSAPSFPMASLMSGGTLFVVVLAR